MDADRSSICCPVPSIPRRSDRHGRAGGGDPRRFLSGGEDRGGRSALREGTVFPRRLRWNTRASAFDIVTVEGEGCSAAGWEEMMSRGDTARITDGISADDRAFAGFDNNSRIVQQLEFPEIRTDSWSRAQK